MDEPADTRLGAAFFVADVNPIDRTIAGEGIRNGIQAIFDHAVDLPHARAPACPRGVLLLCVPCLSPIANVAFELF